MPQLSATRRKPRNLAVGLVDKLTAEIRDGRLAPGDKLPTEAAIMEAFGVSRTVVREAISRMQAAGYVETRHGVGTFALGPVDNSNFRIHRDQLATLQEVIALMELRISVETEAAALAASRRATENLEEMRSALREFEEAVEAGRDALDADVRFHREIGRATQNHHFHDLMNSLGDKLIPRSRIESHIPASIEQKTYLRRVNQQHESIFNAILNRDAEGARAAMRTHLSTSRDRLRRSTTNGDRIEIQG